MVKEEEIATTNFDMCLNGVKVNILLCFNHDGNQMETRFMSEY